MKPFIQSVSCKALIDLNEVKSIYIYYENNEGKIYSKEMPTDMINEMIEHLSVKNNFNIIRILLNYE